jgi:anthranilate synthase/aminodeoxychorismate synthase-like glutamine amidotransferase
MILVIDNYDSFTYNLVQAVGAMGHRVEVCRNDKITARQVAARSPRCIIISPGPGTPEDGGVSNEVVSELAGRIPILGVCLGHQCIAHTYGAVVARAERLMHGKTSPIEHDGRTLFTGLPNPFTATRYHSLIVREQTLPETFEVSARTADRGEVMGIRHKTLPLEGVQFHPESFLCAEGPRLLANFIAGVGHEPPAPAAGAR